MNPKPLFEAITDKQALLIEMLVNERIDLSTDEIDSMITELTGIPSIGSMSKQEASFIIDTLMDKQEWDLPRSPRTEDEIEGDCSSLPSYKQIYALRKHVQELGWTVERFSEWLMKHANVSSIKALDREKTKAAYNAMFYVLKARN
ncbi:MAG: hypothetical protein KJ737_19475 [Proteobacteria bacterium]|nr:hypothetical protein [Pseudomonadota bacterium]